MAFDAGAIVATLDLDRTPFSAGLRAARAEGEAFGREKFTAKVNVDADTGKADAALAATDAEAKKLDGKTVNVNVDKKSITNISQAGSGLSLLTAAIAGLGPAALPVLGAVTVGVAGLSTGLTAAAAGAGAFGLLTITTLQKVSKVEKQAADLRLKAASASGKQKQAYLEQAAALEGTLTPAERKLGDTLADLKSKWTGLQGSLSPVIFKALVPWLSLLSQNMGTLRVLVTPAATAIRFLGQEAKTALGSPFWQNFFSLLGSEGGVALQAFGNILGFIATGMAHLFTVAVPVFNQMLPGITGLARGFAQWAASKKPAEDLQKLIGFVADHGPQMVAVFRAAGPAIAAVVQGAAGASGASLNGILVVLQVIGSMSPGQVQAIAAGFLAWKVAMTGLGIANQATALVKFARTIPGIIKAVREWTIVQGLLDIVLDANPIGIIVLALAALVTAFILAYKNSATFRAFVSAALNGVKTAALAVAHWFAGPFVNFFKSAWNGITTAARAVAGFFTSTLPHFFVSAGHAIAAPFLWLYHTVMIPVWHGIRALLGPVQIAFRVFEVFASAAQKAVGLAAIWLWKNAVGPAFHGIQAVTRAVYSWVNAHVFGPMWTALHSVGNAGLWLWRNAITPAFHGAQTVMHAVYTWTNAHVFGPFYRAMHSVGGAATWLWHSAITPAWNGLRNTVLAGWNFLRSKVFNPLGHMMTSTIPSAFRRGASLAGQGWAALQNLAKKPANFLIYTVYDKGIRGVVGKVASWVGKPNPLPYVKMLAAGGPVPAAQVGWTNTPTAVVGEGSRKYPEVVIPTDPAYRSRALNLYSQLGGRLMAGGGVIGTLDDWILDPTTKLTSAIASKTKGLYEAFGHNPWVQMLGAIPPKLATMMASKIESWFALGGSGDFISILKSALGRPYVWGATGPNAFDCSGLIYWALRKMGIHAPRTSGAQYAWTKHIPKSQAVPGDLAFWDPGHIHHVGAFLGNNQVLNAPHTGANVRIQSLWGHPLFGRIPGLAAAMAGGGAGGPLEKQGHAWATAHGITGAQWNALDYIVSHESGWRLNAQNPHSTAHGLGQFINATARAYNYGSTLNSQLSAVVRYARNKYGGLLQAERFWQRHHYYDSSSVQRPGILPPGATLAVNNTGRNEYITDRPPGPGSNVSDTGLAQRLDAILATLQRMGFMSGLTINAPTDKARDLVNELGHAQTVAKYRAQLGTG